MDVILKQHGGHVLMFADKRLMTVFKNKSIEFVSAWVCKNLKNTKIHIVK